MDFSTLGEHVRNARIFHGPHSKPFLAPRGIHVHDGKLFVSDTGRNRVFIWHHLPTTEFAEPDVVLGQTDAEATSRNAGGDANGSTLRYPSGIWSAGQKLIVADAWNHRVLVWHTLPERHGQPADVVIGQPDFSGELPNVGGMASASTARSLNWPYGVFSDGTRLWIADTGNRRVLLFNTIPSTNYAEADAVIGKSGFEDRDYNGADAVWPYSVKVSTDGCMVITDTQFYRALLWKNEKDAIGKPADSIIGQAAFTDSGQNQYRLAPEANTLNWCYDSCFHRGGLLVNDTGNSRLLWFKKVPTMNNATADAVIGRPDARTGSEFKGNMHGTESALYWPFSICTEGDQLFIADTGNHRLVIGDLQLPG